MEQCFTTFLIALIVGLILLLFEYRTRWFAQHVARKFGRGEGDEQKDNLAALWGAFFGTWDRRLSLVSGVLSLIAISLTALFGIFPEPAPPYIVLRDLAALFGLVSIFAVLLSKYAQRGLVIQRQIQQVDQLRSDLSRQLKETHDILHNYRNSFFSYFLPFLLEHLAFEVTEKELKLFRSICFFTTSGLRETFLQYFKFRQIDVGDDISISVKLIIPSNKIVELFPHLSEDQEQQIRKREKWVITVFRDPYTYNHHHEREVGSAIYDIGGNTAFHHVVENGQPYFLSNNLAGWGENYRNENLEWRERYNSTLVVPIRYRDATFGQQLCFGFLAVDSLNRDGIELYNSSTCKHILSHSADLLATFFLSLALFKFESRRQ